MTAHDPIHRLVGELSRLPGIGEKTATRLAFFIVRQPRHYALNLAQALTEVTQQVRFCGVCQNMTAVDPCRYCTDVRRQDRALCVVENVQTLRAIESTQEFRGRYHVLHGLIAPLDGVGPDELRIKELMQRLRSTPDAPCSVEEIIFAFSPTLEGDATTLYLNRLIAPLGIQTTRLAQGVAVGSDLEYADHASLTRALLERRTV